MKAAHIKLPKNVQLSDDDDDEEEHDHDHDDEDEEELETEIISITDATTGEPLNFHIEGEDFDQIIPSDFFSSMKSLVRKQ